MWIRFFCFLLQTLNLSAFLPKWISHAKPCRLCEAGDTHTLCATSIENIANLKSGPSFIEKLHWTCIVSHACLGKIIVLVIILLCFYNSHTTHTVCEAAYLLSMKRVCGLPCWRSIEENLFFLNKKWSLNSGIFNIFDVQVISNENWAKLYRNESLTTTTQTKETKNSLY